MNEQLILDSLLKVTRENGRLRGHASNQRKHLGRLNSQLSGLRSQLQKAIGSHDLTKECNRNLQAEIETLRKQLADANRAASDEFTERQVLTVEQQQDAAIWQQQLDVARAEVETLRQQLADAANAAVTLQRAYIQRLQAFVGKVREARDEHNGLDRDARVEAALAELDGEPTPATEAEGGK